MSGRRIEQRLLPAARYDARRHARPAKPRRAHPGPVVYNVLADPRSPLIIIPVIAANMLRSIVASAFLGLLALIPFALAIGTPLGFGSGQLIHTPRSLKAVIKLLASTQRRWAVALLLLRPRHRMHSC